MSTSHTPIPPGHSVQVVFTVRANRSLYGYAYGPFRYDELRGCFVFQSRTFSVQEWEKQGADLIQKWYKYRPSVRVEVVPTPEMLKAAPAAEPSAPAPSLPVPGDVTAPTPEAEPEATAATEPAAAEPVKRTRAKKATAATEPAAE